MTVLKFRRHIDMCEVLMTHHPERIKPSLPCEIRDLATMWGVSERDVLAGINEALCYIDDKVKP